MKPIIVTLLALFSITIVKSQELNTALKMKLDSIHFSDQALRELLQPAISNEKKAEVLEKLGYDAQAFEQDKWKVIKHQDSINLAEVKKIIATYGYPGKSLVGEPASFTAWLVIQHSHEIETYFPIIREAGEHDEINKTFVAIMEDRMLMYRKQEQIYGSQSSGKRIKDEATGAETTVYFIWPIKDPDHVNELRKSAGFPDTVEEYAKSMGIDYKVVKLGEVVKKSEDNQ
ncbi:MAG TPA: hypothetical protein DCR43_05565 [Bacteroidales bacterium]|nr:MAG: hypothetical protein A2X11_04135 [Bacteroidetes bacterium GWE2_42_24]OFY26056.1 MAG: hypothetical protein A2X09_11370 [Bacteroidetes bacterium GWF2_43_11]HAQ65302.1 hypothetical protein [Bacteroidales bacterium]HBZ65363.1 hypothetical protein [Bacteroidales bacterium]